MTKILRIATLALALGALAVPTMAADKAPAAGYNFINFKFILLKLKALFCVNKYFKKFNY